KLAPLLVRIKPRMFGWFPNSPAAALAAELRTRKGRVGWPPPGVVVEEIRGEVAAACMGFAALGSTGQIAHSGDPLADDHLRNAGRIYAGNPWTFVRQRAVVVTGDDEEDEPEKVGHVTAAYALAGAAHLARTVPAPRAVTLPSPVGADA